MSSDIYRLRGRAKRGRIVATALAVIAALIAVVPPAANASPNSITVTTETDGVTGSLRDAITHAAAGDSVILPAGTYVLTQGELMINKTLTISGAGAATTFIDGLNGQRFFRDIHIDAPGSQVTISGVTVRNGLALPPTGVPQPEAAQVQGGGIFNDQATLTLVDDVIAHNRANANGRATSGAGGLAEGGGVASTGPLNLVRTDFVDNHASAGGADGQGGGLAEGGGVWSQGPLDVRGTTFEANGAEALGGGQSQPTVLNSGQIGGDADGAGLEAQNATSVSASTFNDNVADASAGPGAAGGDALGGGAMLGIGSAAISTMTNVTFTRNVARTRAANATSRGGAIFFFGDNPGQKLTNATLTANSAAGGGINQGGNIFVTSDAAATLKNTVIASGAADPGSDNCGALGALVSLGNNIDSQDQCNFHAAGDVVGKDPLLGPLANNGGPVQTVALNSGSPAINAAATAACPPTDARGVLRPAGGGCDAGAFEIAGASATTAPAGSVTTGSAVLNGLASNPDLASGTAFFQYGTTIGYGSSSPVQPVNPTTAQGPVSTQLAGLSPGTTYHFRLVTRNAIGTATGADQTFTTAQQGTGAPPPPPSISVRSVSVTGATALARVACQGAMGQQCSGNLQGTVQERLRGRTIVAVRASVRRRQTTKTVIVATGRYAIQAGHVATLRISANATGRKLLLRFFKLPTTFVFTAPTRTSRTITFAYPPVRWHLDYAWSGTSRPCGPCVTVVQQLTLTRLASATQITLSCNGPGCPFARQVLRPRRSRIELAGMLKHNGLQTGTKLEIWITAPNHVGVALQYTMRTAAVPRGAMGCLPPGARLPVACPRQ